MKKVRVPLARGLDVAADLTRRLKAAGARKIQVAGSIRRRQSQVGDIDVIVIASAEPRALLEAAGCKVDQGGSERAFGSFQGMSVNLWKTTPTSWGAMLFYTTGPAAYSGFGYRSKAKKAGMLLNEKGLFRNGKQIAGDTEESIYTALGKEYKAPELRGLK